MNLELLDNGFMITITELYIYPVKSLLGIALNEAETNLRGFKFDREWMITDSDYQFVTQRQIEKMATITTSIDSNTLTLEAESQEPLTINLHTERNNSVIVSVWNDICKAYDEGEGASFWLTKVLGQFCGQSLRLVRFSQHEKRLVPTQYSEKIEAQSAFSDQFPYLITSIETLKLVNETLIEKGFREIAMNRFRPNIVIKGLSGIEQKTSFDLLAKDGSYRFGLRKPRKRCKITTIDQNTGEIHEPKEPLSTLTELNLCPEVRGAFFGQNAIHLSTVPKLVRVGDKLKINTTLST